MLASPLPPSFFDTYSLSTFSLGCNALWVVVSFHVLWSICLSSSHVHFKKGPEYLKRDTAQVFILIKSQLDGFFSCNFLVPLRYAFIFTCLMVLASQMSKYLYVSFSSSVLILSWFGSFIPSVICRVLLFITSMAHFSMPSSIPMCWLYILTECIKVFCSFSFFANSLMPSLNISWLIFTCDLLSLYSSMHIIIIIIIHLFIYTISNKYITNLRITYQTTCKHIYCLSWENSTFKFWCC